MKVLGNICLIDEGTVIGDVVYVSRRVAHEVKFVVSKILQLWSFVSGLPRRTV